MPVAFGALAALTVLEWYFRLDFSLGVFYTLPVLISGTVLSRWEVAAFGILCAAARSAFTPAGSEIEFVLKCVMASIAYCATGLLVVEMSTNRRTVIASYAQLQLEQERRRRAEEQLRTLSAGSPAAILTVSANCIALAANRAAHDMLGFDADTLTGQDVTACFPIFADALKMASKDRHVRTSATAWARRRDGQLFPIQTWFSVHGAGESRSLAAIVVDMSEDVRDRERENFQHLLDYNRLLAGAVSHEIRNLCSAIAVVCSNLSARPDLRASADFDALTRLVDGLSTLASFELGNSAGHFDSHTDLKGVLDQLRIVIEPDWEEIDGAVHWAIPAHLNPVAADAHGLMQVFLNLCQNSLRAVQSGSPRRLTVTATPAETDVLITFRDTGPGVAHPDRLFHPFRPGADGSGLGLYISRELARSYGGDLEFIPTPEGCEFRVIVPLAHAAVKEAALARA